MKKLMPLIALAVTGQFFTLSSSFASPMDSSIRATTRAINQQVRTSTRPKVKEINTETYKTTVNLNMRNKPSSSGTVLKTLKKGTSAVTTGKTKGVWWEISSNNHTGWVHSKYLSQ